MANNTRAGGWLCAMAAAGLLAGARAGPPSSSNVSLFTQVAGPNQAQAGGLPPDGDIATSSQWMVQVVNDLVTMYNWNTNAFKQVNLETLFQDSGGAVLFDPRVIHD